MSIWNKVLFGLIFVVLMVNIYLAAQSMHLRRHYRTRINSDVERIEQTLTATDKMVRGDKPEEILVHKKTGELSIEELQVKLETLIAARQRAWFGCQLLNIKEDGLQISPTIQSGGDQKPVNYVTVNILSEEDPINALGTTYLFSEGTENVPPMFLGIFNATESQSAGGGSGTQTTFVAAVPMNEEEVERLDRCRAGRLPIAVYTVMPADRQHDFFDPAVGEENQPVLYNNLSPDAFDANIPAAKRDAFADAKRPLQGFDSLITTLYRQREDLHRTITMLNRGIATLQTSLEDSATEQKFWDDEIALEKKRIEAMTVQRDAVKQLSDEMDAQIADLQQKIEQTQQRNEWYVSRIAEYQLKVAELIEAKQPPSAVE